MAIINRYLICFVFLSLLIPSFLFAEDADITFLYTGDLHHFVKEEKDTPVFVSGGTLIDGTGAAPRDNPGILIQEGDFREIGTASAPKGVKQLDATGKWILPGLIDVHGHITYHVPTGWNVEDDVMNAIRAERFMELYQKIGVTTIADVGSRYKVGYSLKRAQRMGLLGGPRLYVSGPVLTAPAGHATEFIPLEPPVYAVTATGPWMFRQRVREAVNLGADFIKVVPPYTPEELGAVVKEADYWKIFVTAHIGGVPDLHLISSRVAADAGVHSVQHLYPYGKDRKKVLRDMAKKNIYVVPTMGYHMRELQGKAHVKGNWTEIHLGHTYDNVMSLFKDMQNAGLKFAVGTDSNPMDMLKIDQIYLEELQALAHGGLSAMQIIQSATLHAAESIRRDEETGSITAGKWADMIIVSSNPLENLETMVKPELVMQQGKIVHQK